MRMNNSINYLQSNLDFTRQFYKFLLNKEAIEYQTNYYIQKMISFLFFFFDLFIYFTMTE